jgi:hypothetical protein
MNQWMRCAWVVVAAFAAGASAPAEEISRVPLSLDVLSLQAAPPRQRPSSLADGTSVRFRGYGIWSSASGNLDFNDDDSPVPGAIHDIDLEDTLGMDLDQFTGGALLGFNFGPAHLDLSYNGYYDYDGDRDVGTIVFNDNVYAGRVTSSLQIHEGAVNFRYDLWQAENVDLTLSPEFGVRVFYEQAEINESLTGRDDSVEFWAPVPTPGVSLRWGLSDNLYLKGTAAGFYAGDLAGYYDLAAELGYDINQNVGVFVGYRFWSLDVEWDDDAVDVQNGSLYAGVELRM